MKAFLRRVAEFGGATDDFPVVRVSNIPQAGMGLFAGREGYRQGELVCLYPGTVYMPGDTGIFFSSVRNDYVRRVFVPSVSPQTSSVPKASNDQAGFEIKSRIHT